LFDDGHDEAVATMIKSKSINNKEFRDLMRCPVILDVDYDFFFNSENCITDFPAKVIQRDILESFSNIFKDVSFEKVVSHEEALTVWDQNNYQDITCLHIDYHHDWHVDRELLKSLTLYSIEEVINCANYAAIAAKFGIIKNFIWIRPDNHVNYDIIDPKKEFSLNKVSFTNMTWSEFVNLFSQNIDISIIDSGIMCLSPDFIPEKNMWEFFTKYKCSDEFVSRALIYVKEALFNHRFTIQKNNSDFLLKEESFNSMSSFAKSVTLKHLSFDEGVVLEMDCIETNLVANIVFMGQSYCIKKLNNKNCEAIKNIITKFNISKIFVLPEARKIYLDNFLNISLDAEIIFCWNNSDEVFLPYFNIDNEFLNLFYSEGFPDSSNVKEITLLNQFNEIHISVNQKNIENILENASDLLSVNTFLVFNGGKNKSHGPELRKIAERVFKKKMENPELLSALKIITTLSWCWVDEPLKASSVLMPAISSYSPLLIPQNLVEETNLEQNITNKVIEKNSFCKGCMYEINCIASDLKDQFLKSSPPSFHQLFSGWRPYLNPYEKTERIK